MSEPATEWWFHLPDVLTLIRHTLLHTHVYDTTQPHLHLHTQGRLVFLTATATTPILVNPYDPASAQRVYAIGHSHHTGGTSTAADPTRYGPPAHVGAWPLLHQAGGHPPLAQTIREGDTAGHGWLVITHHTGGGMHLHTQPLPRPRTPGHWQPVTLHRYGQPAGYLADIVDNHATIAGWCLPRFSNRAATRILTDTGRRPAPDLPPVHLDTAPAGTTRPVTVITADADGYYRLGDPAWCWVSPDLLPDGELVTKNTPPDDADGHPAIGQAVYHTGQATYWLDPHRGLWTCDRHDLCPQPVDYRDTDPRTAMRRRAIAHHLLTHQPADG